jgi:hypothetical protein
MLAHVMVQGGQALTAGKIERGTGKRGEGGET